MLAISADDYWDTAFARLPPGIRKADRRLVADSGVLPRLYGAYLCGIPHLGQAESDSGGLLILLAGEFGANLFLSRISLLIVLTGVIVAVGGARLVAELGFPLMVLLLAIPIPALIFNQIALPLQMLASQVASLLLGLFGVPVLQQGNVIQLASMNLEVAEACSGIRCAPGMFNR
jgi:exosortase